MNPVLFTRAGDIIEQLRYPTPHQRVDVQPLTQCGCQLLEFCGKTIAEFRERKRAEREALAESWGTIYRVGAKKRPRAAFVHCELRRIGNRMVEIGQMRTTVDDDIDVALFATTSGEKLSQITLKQLAAD